MGRHGAKRRHGLSQMNNEPQNTDMSQSSPPTGQGPAEGKRRKADRKKDLAQALRSNLRRRKGAGSGSEAPADDRPADENTKSEEVSKD